MLSARLIAAYYSNRLFRGGRTSMSIAEAALRGVVGPVAGDTIWGYYGRGTATRPGLERRTLKW